MKPNLFAAIESLLGNLLKVVTYAPDSLILNKTKQKLENTFIHSENCIKMLEMLLKCLK